MEALSQGGGRDGRTRWTDEHQRRAEELQAQGLSHRAIGRELGFSHNTIRFRLDPEAHARGLEKKRQWREAHREELARKSREWYWEDPERARKSARDSRNRNLEACKLRCRSYYRANAERCNENSRRWAGANREKVRESRRLASRRWCEANPEAARARTRRWRAANPDKTREATRRSSARRKAGRRRALVPVSLDQLRGRFRLFGHRCAYCGAADGITVDHVLPLKAGGLDEAGNIVPACLRCNCSKQAQPVAQWYCAQPFFTEARWQQIQKHCPCADGQLSLALLPSVA